MLDAQSGDPEELTAREAIESFSSFGELQTKETKKYFINVRQLDDGNKEVRIRMKETGPKICIHIILPFMAMIFHIMKSFLHKQDFRKIESPSCLLFSFVAQKIRDIFVIFCALFVVLVYFYQREESS